MVKFMLGRLVSDHEALNNISLSISLSMSQLSVEPSASSSPHTVRRPGEVADEVLEPGQQRSKAYRNHRHCFHQFDPVLFISLSVAIINLQLNHLSLSAIVNPQVKLQSITTRWLQGIH